MRILWLAKRENIQYPVVKRARNPRRPCLACPVFGNFDLLEAKLRALLFLLGLSDSDNS